MGKKAVSIEKQAEHLREYAELHMRLLNLTEVKAETFRAKFRKLPDKVDEVDMDILPADYKRHIPETWEPDKKKILDEYKRSGVEVSGTAILEGRTKLEFK